MTHQPSALLPRFDAPQVQHDPARCLLRFQGLDRANAVVCPAPAHGRELVVTHRPTHALGDFTGMPPLSTQDELWMSGHWLPRIARQPWQRAVPVPRPGQLPNQMAIEALFWFGRHLTRFQFQVFDDVPPALDRLVAGDRAAAQRLQAEWDAARPAPATPALPT